MTDETREEGLAKKAVSRRDFLKYAGLAGGTVAAAGGLGGLIAACGGTTTTTAASTATTAGGVTTTAGGTATTAAGGATTTAVSTGQTPPTQDKIVFGGARPVSGPLSTFETGNWGPAYKLWVKDVNAAGGIKVAGKPLPIELKIYDDQSNLDTSMRLLTKLIEEDKADFVMAPCSTAFLFAAAGVCNAHKYLLMSAEGGATTLEAEMNKGALPYFFQVLNYSDHYQTPTHTAIMQEVGVKTASIVYIDDLHGIEYQAQAQIFFGGAGIKILSNTAVPLDIKDVSSIIKKIQGENPDCVCFYVYPPINPLAAGTMIQLNYSPKMVLWGPTGASQWFYDSFKGALEGCMFEGAYSIHSTPTAKDYTDKVAAFVGAPNVDYWGTLLYRAQLEAFQQAIEQAGTLDQTKVADVLRKGHFKTSMTDDFFFDANQILNVASYAGQIGQWQKGFAEVIDPGKSRTAAPIYPKLGWKEAAASAPAPTTPTTAAPTGSTTASS
jgi:branched-chain amino acid transport system substrate-binding protein